MEASDVTTDPLRVDTPPPEPEAALPLPPARPQHDAANFKAKRQATMIKLYCLFKERWEPMNATCMKNDSFSKSGVSGEIIEKLPEGKT